LGVAKDYVEEHSGGYVIAGTRVSLDSVVYAFLRGESPEGIAESYPALTAEQIFGSLAFYLENRDRIDQYLLRAKEDFECLRQQAHQNNPGLYARLSEARQKRKGCGAHLKSVRNWLAPRSVLRVFFRRPITPERDAAFSGGRGFQPKNRPWPAPQGTCD